MSDEAIEALLVRIQRHLDARTKAGAGSTTAAATGHDVQRRFSPAVYERLEEAEAVLDAISVQPSLTPPHLPLVGPLWQRVRAAAHHLVVFYVNRLAGAQGVFNRELLGGLTALIDDLEQDTPGPSDREIGALRAEVQALRGEVEALKARSAGDGR